MEEVRLQKYLADCGIASRRKCEEIIKQGRVEVNSKKITKLGAKVIIGKDEIKYDGKIVLPQNDFVYILLNKPIGYVTTVHDQFSRDTVMDLVNVKQRVIPVR